MSGGWPFASPARGIGDDWPEVPIVFVPRSRISPLTETCLPTYCFSSSLPAASRTHEPRSMSGGVAGAAPHAGAALDERRTVRRRHGGLGLGCGLADAAQLIAVAWRGDDASLQRDAIVHAPLAPGLHAALVIRRVVGAGHGERGRKDGDGDV